MNNSFYPKLAFSNIKKNRKTYIPYILVSIFTIGMFSIMFTLKESDSIKEMPRGETLIEMLDLGTYVIGIFAVLILFYTNSFLMKQRKKELGLYNILGMEKKHIAKMLFMETVFTSLFSVILGIFTGLLLSQFMYLVLVKIINFDVSLRLSFSILSLVSTTVLFILIFLVILLYNMLKVRLTNPIDLLKGGQQGEREPKTKWLTAVIGFIALGVAYYLALIIESPMEALLIFFIAVILVIVGTYCLFIAGSIAILKILRKNKEFYYKSQNFIAISGMIYRMKQHAAGLASICILSTMVLVTLSTTVSLYVGQDDILDKRFPQDFRIISSQPTEENISTIKGIVNEEIQNYGATPKNLMGYKRESAWLVGNNGRFVEAGDSDRMNLYWVIFVTEEDYSELIGETVSLKENEVLLYSSEDYAYDTIEIAGETFSIVEKLESSKVFEAMESDMDTVVLVVRDMGMINNVLSDLEATYYLKFDLPAVDEDVEVEFTNTLKTKLESVDNTYLKSRQEAADDFLATFGGMLFLGIFLGTLFLMATGLIIYYKQISEGYEDKERFHIMQKVGMSKEEVKRTIRTQTLMVFFLPLMMAIVHIAFAFPVITKILSLFALTNVTLFVICTAMTIFVFAVIYVLLYRLTARAYYKIVS